MREKVIETVLGHEVWADRLNRKRWAERMSAPFEWADEWVVNILPFTYHSLTVRVWTLPAYILPTTILHTYLLSDPIVGDADPAGLEVLYI